MELTPSSSIEKFDTERPPEDFFVPYPPRDDKDIQSIVYSKREFRECLSGPNPLIEKERVDKLYFNSQVLYQRLLHTYGSIMLLFEQSSGKTGCFKCYHDYMTKNHPGVIKRTYYVSAAMQAEEFKEQVVYGHFGLKEDKDELISGKTNKATISRRRLDVMGIELMTYDKFASFIASMSNEEVIKKFCSACVIIDECHEVKLNETEDLGRKKRDRLEHYEQYWRLSILCPTCVFTLASGTPITDKNAEFIYHMNLLPNTKKIRTKLSEQIAHDVCKDYNIRPETIEWSDPIDFEEPVEWTYDFEEGSELMTADEILEAKAQVDKQYEVDLNMFVKRRESDLEPVIRGRIMYIRAPITEAVIRNFDYDEALMLSKIYGYHMYDYKIYDENDSRFQVSDWREVKFDHELMMSFTHVRMSKFQTLGYLHCMRGQKRDRYGLYVLARQAGTVVFPTEDYAKDCVKLGVSEADNVHLPDYDFNDSYGGPGYDTCFKLVKRIVKRKKPTTPGYQRRTADTEETEVYEPSDWFLKYLKIDACLYNTSAIVWDIVWLITREEGFPVYIPSMNLTSTLGTIEAALIARDYTRFTGEDEDELTSEGLPLSKGKRFAVISSKENKSYQNIIRAWGHPKNVMREYIAALLVSPAGTTGVNIPNAGHCCVPEPDHNSAPTRQATARIMRPNAHKASAKLVKGEPWNWDEFPVYMHYYMPDLYGYGNDDDMNELLELANLGENWGLVDGLDDSNSPLWTVAHWRVYGNAHEKELKEARLFHSIKRCAVDYQMNIGRNMLRNDIKDFTFKADFTTVRYDAYNCNSKWPVDTRTYDSYYLESKKLWETGDLLDSIVDVPYTTAISIATENPKYTSNEIMYALRRVVERQSAIGTNYMGFPLTLKEDRGIFYPSHDFVQDPSSALIPYTRTTVFNSTSTIDSISGQWLHTELVEEYKHDAEEAGNYLDFFAAEVPNLYKAAILEEALLLKLYNKRLPKWASRVLDAHSLLFCVVKEREDQYVLLHQIHNLYAHIGHNYVAVDSIVSPKRGICMYVTSSSPLESGAWKLCNDIENQYYSKFLHDHIERILYTYYKAFEHLGFIGVTVRNDEVHARMFTSKIDKDGKKVYKSHSKGQNLKSSDTKAQLSMLYALTPEAHHVRVTDKKRGELIKFFSEKRTKGRAGVINAKTLAEFPSSKLLFFEKQLESPPAPSFGKQIAEKLLAIGAVVPIVGDPKVVVDSMT